MLALSLFRSLSLPRSLSPSLALSLAERASGLQNRSAAFFFEDSPEEQVVSPSAFGSNLVGWCLFERRDILVHIQKPHPRNGPCLVSSGGRAIAVKVAAKRLPVSPFSGLLKG